MTSGSSEYKGHPPYFDVDLGVRPRDQLIVMFRAAAARLPALHRALPMVTDLGNRGEWEQVVRFVMFVATQESFTRERFAEELQILAPRPRGEVMTYIEEIKQKAREEGRLEGQIHTIESLLRAGASWPFIKSAIGIDEAGLGALKQRLTASSAANSAEDTE